MGLMVGGDLQPWEVKAFGHGTNDDEPHEVAAFFHAGQVAPDRPACGAVQDHGDGQAGVGIDVDQVLGTGL